MSLWRNREIKRFAVAVSVLSTVLVIIGFSSSREAGILVLITAFLLCSTFFAFTAYRYRQIRKLSDYLRRICAGEHSLDIRDNVEGELSILKNEIYKVTLMLSEYNKKLQREKLLLSEHMADISHQLKTPLTSMMVMIDLLGNEDLPPEKRREFTARISSQLKRIEWLVSSLLKMARLDAGVVKMKRERVKVRTLIENALKPLLIPMEVKGITCTVTGQDETLTCDLQWTTEAIINILKNCIEHAPEHGKIEIAAKDNPLYFEIRISDNGPGISKEDLPHIFTRFYRGKNASPDSVGIGLAMARSIIKEQNGDITVESREGRGATFFIRLYKAVI
ncbi:sensor histidine kinase [Caldicoprobacter faecalis]|uniref:histidine kinase n=1 Tax=Caldicoprobacter faecalis TaxID=937334 RepID=A0A1I5TCI9_9FIRM|nr:HAMP domain-containing sensor histidine kinase [Caldicoprobacter faecalis]SFP80754.1 His Kinase A (phospho-acceptor) domain-containing protein [Caldicoprobacter faecalis]